MTNVKQSDEAKLMELHYAYGVEFPLFHEPLYPLQNRRRTGAQPLCRGKHYTQRTMAFSRKGRQYQRG